MEAVDAGGHLIIRDTDTLLLFNTMDSGLYRIESITEKLFILIKKHGIEAARDIIKQEDVKFYMKKVISILYEEGYMEYHQEHLLFPFSRLN